MTTGQARAKLHPRVTTEDSSPRATPDSEAPDAAESSIVPAVPVSTVVPSPAPIAREHQSDGQPIHGDEVSYPAPAARGSATAVASGHLTQLDGLRAIAVAGVLLSHAGPTIFAHGINTGPLGVRLFFVLSGFLITGILLRARAEWTRKPATARGGSGGGSSGVRGDVRGARGGALRAFYARRFLRIFPLYYLVLFAITAFGLPEARETFWWNLLYSSNYYYALHGQWQGAVSHFWSLAVEEQFYLVWPWLVLFTPLARLPMLLGATVVAAPVSRLFLARATGSLIMTSTPTIACLDSLGAGALLAWLWYAPDNRNTDGDEREQRVRRFARIALIVGIASWLAMDVCWWLNTGWTVRMALWDLTVSLVFAWLVNGAARGFRGPAGALLSSRPLVYLGTISYGIYVYHPFIDPAVRGLGNLLHVAVPFPEDGGALRFACVSLGAILMASISWRFYERPLNDLKSRFSYTGAGAEAGARTRTAAAPQHYVTASPERPLRLDS